MPNAFIAAAKGETESSARKRMIVELHDANALEKLFQAMKLHTTLEP